MVICECGANLKSISQKHLNSKTHLTKLKSKSGSKDTSLSKSSLATSNKPSAGLENRVATLEKQMNNVLDELVTLQRAIQSLGSSKSTSNYNLNATEILNVIGRSGGINNWITIDSAYASFKNRNIPFDPFQSKIIELTDNNKIELGDGRSNYKIKNRGFEFGLIRLL